MRKIRVTHDLYIPGWGRIPARTEFKVERYNQRFVYVLVGERVELRLARKSDCQKVY